MAAWGATMTFDIWSACLSSWTMQYSSRMPPSPQALGRLQPRKLHVSKVAVISTDFSYIMDDNIRIAQYISTAFLRTVHISPEAASIHGH
jgi:hypothetical protein